MDTLYRAYMGGLSGTQKLNCVFMWAESVRSLWLRPTGRLLASEPHILSALSANSAHLLGTREEGSGELNTAFFWRPTRMGTWWMLG